MATRNHAAFILGLSLCLSAPVYGDEQDTMVLLEEGDTPEDIVQTIALPDSASAAAQDSASHGHQTAQEAKLHGRSFGQSVAEQAKLGSTGEDLRADVRDNARRDARGNNGQGGDHSGRPE